MNILTYIGNSRQYYDVQLTIHMIQMVSNHTKTDMRSSAASNVKYFDILACKKDNRDSKKSGV